jgi:hypothetical protein
MKAMLVSQEVAQAMEQLNIASINFHRISANESEAILENVQKAFLEEVGARWWWEHFRVRGCAVRFKQDNAFQHLSQIIQPMPKQLLWFIAEERLEDSYVFRIPGIPGRKYQFHPSSSR